MFDRALAAFEIIARPDFAGRATDGVADFGKVSTRNDIETRNGNNSYLLCVSKNSTCLSYTKSTIFLLVVS